MAHSIHFIILLKKMLSFELIDRSYLKMLSFELIGQNDRSYFCKIQVTLLKQEMRANLMAAESFGHAFGDCLRVESQPPSK